MSEINLTKDLESNAIINLDLLKSKVVDNLKQKFDKFEIIDSNRFECRVKTKFFNPVVSIKGRIEFKCQENTGKVQITAKPTTNLWFWFTFGLALIPPTVGWMFLVLIWMWHSQKQKSIQAMRDAIESLSFDLWQNSGLSKSNTNNYESLGKLHGLLKDGAITQEEFETQKKKLIA